MINYQYIEDSINHYSKWGFQRVESPWTVTQYVDNITKPKTRLSMKLEHNEKCLVGSGEQSFLYMYLKGFLPLGMFQTVTPCFRHEPFDGEHSKYFLKNELIRTKEVNDYSLQHMITRALNFFSVYLPDPYTVKTEEGYDIMWRGVELGSYGIRSCEFLEWIYGTGCAEPRLSGLVKKYELSQKEN